MAKQLSIVGHIAGHLRQGDLRRKTGDRIQEAGTLSRKVMGETGDKRQELRDRRS